MKKGSLILSLLIGLALFPALSMATEAANREAYPNFVPIGRDCDTNSIKWPTTCNRDGNPTPTTPVTVVPLKQQSFFARFRAYLASFRSAAF